MTHIELLMKMLEKYETLKEEAWETYDERYFEGCVDALDEAIQYLKGMKEFKED